MQANGQLKSDTLLHSKEREADAPRGHGMPKRKAEPWVGEGSGSHGEGIVAPVAADPPKVQAESIQVLPAEGEICTRGASSQQVEGKADEASEVASGAELFWALLAQAGYEVW